MSIGDFLESLSRAMLVGTMLVGRLGVVAMRRHRNNSNIAVVINVHMIYTYDDIIYKYIYAH